MIPGVNSEKVRPENTKEIELSKDNTEKHLIQAHVDEPSENIIP